MFSEEHNQVGLGMFNQLLSPRCGRVHAQYAAREQRSKHTAFCKTRETAGYEGHRDVRALRVDLWAEQFAHSLLLLTAKLRPRDKWRVSENQIYRRPRLLS